MTKNAILGVSMVLAAFAAAPASAQTIDFDGVTAPCNFNETAPLTNQYSSQGVTFSGVGGVGGSILNNCGNFGLAPRSGANFLAFNTGVNTAQERIVFATPATMFSLYVGSSAVRTFTADFFNAASVFLGSVSVSNTAGQYAQLSYAGPFSSVVFGANGPVFVADDLSFSTRPGAVPEPATWAMLILGFGLIGGAMRYRRGKTAVSFG